MSAPEESAPGPRDNRPRAIVASLATAAVSAGCGLLATETDTRTAAGIGLLVLGATLSGAATTMSARL